MVTIPPGTTIEITEVIKMMDEIQKENQLSYEAGEDARYTWPDRWAELRKRLEAQDKGE